jgi:uncharacterized protein (TIGR02285 family)
MCKNIRWVNHHAAGLCLNMPFLMVIFCSAFLFTLTAQAKEKITWVKWTLTPEYIEKGEYEGQGYLDKFLDYTTALMPEYEHESEFQTLNRINLSWSEGNVCSLHLWLGYWPTKIVYSKPYGFTPRFGIVARRDSEFARNLGDVSTVSLKNLLSSTDYKVGVLPLYYTGAQNSRYPLLAPILSSYLQSGRVNEFSNNRNEMSVAFLDKKRADYIIRQRITHYSELKINHVNDNYKYYYLEEGMKHKLVAGACSNSKLGKEVIEKFNSLINDDFYTAYLNYRQEWDQDNTDFDNLYKSYFLKGIASPVVTE